MPFTMYSNYNSNNLTHVAKSENGFSLLTDNLLAEELIT